MSGDYLWDGSGPRDPETVELERLLGQFKPAAVPPLAATAPGVSATSGDPEPARGWTPRAVLAMAASLAAVAALVLAVWTSGGDVDVPVMVARLEGAPLVGGQVLAGRQRLAADVSVTTDAHARARVDVGTVGQIELAPGSQLDLRHARLGMYRVRLQRGTMHAIVRAQPGRFAVDTPSTSSTIVDLGSVFTLSVDDAGHGQVHVRSGWVGVEGQGREAFVPAGATCPMQAGRGPGATRFEDAPQPMQAALDTIEQGADSPHVEQAVDQVLSQARERDAVTLWHLIPRVEGPARDRLFDRLSSYVPVPPDVTREGVCAGREDMLERWRSSLGDDTDAWWPAWKHRRD